MEVMKILSYLPHTNFESIKSLPDVVFFDYDGTINDNDKYILKAIKYTTNKNLKKQDIKAVSKIKGDSEKWVYIKDNCKKDVFEKCNYDYDEYLNRQKITLRRNVIKLIKLLYKYDRTMIIVSQKSGDGLREDLKKIGLSKYFDGVFGTLDIGMLQKPSKEFLDEVRKITKTKTKSCWMIGDRKSDVITALNMEGKAFIIGKNDILKIREDYKELIGKDIFFTSFNKLIKLVKKLKKYIESK